MELKALVALFIHVTVILSESTVRADCTISINKDLKDPQPLVLNPSGGNGIHAFLLPTNGDTILLKENQLVDVACPGNSVLVDGVSIDAAIGQASCSSTRFVINGKTVPFSSITCNSHATHTARLTGSSCLSNYQEAEIGFAIDANRFIRIITLCWDRARQSTLYSQFTLTKTIAGYQVAYPRPSFLQASGRGWDLTVYTGVHGVSTLPHESDGHPVDLYLYVSGAARGMPVPRLTWKVVHNPLTRAGVAIITVNNPYVFDASKDVICTNICNQLNWITFQQTNAAIGYSYCCRVDEFRKNVTSLPNIDVTQVLT
ncbi:DNA/RNA non-specific endonuclease [Popillia japonica]|uniref:DNA/RNA non-specific endonuclease n=1 Tax=Popillia japonica TaxID=7064 RepID=A0AAW1LQA9_POPJA